MIQIEKMNKVFHLKSGDVTALDNVTLNIGDGMIYGVIGYSGAGKSTLVRCLNLLETPDSGTLSVGDSGVITLKDGKAYDAQGRKMTEKKLGAMRRGIGMIFQHFNLLDRSTVFENIAYPLRYTGMKKTDIEARVFELLDLVDLRDTADVYPSQLSGDCPRLGEQAAGAALRRGDQRARSGRDGSHSEPASRPEPQTRIDHRAHHARDGGHQVHLPARGRDGKWPRGRGGRRIRHLRASARGDYAQIRFLRVRAEQGG